LGHETKPGAISTSFSIFSARLLFHAVVSEGGLHEPLCLMNLRNFIAYNAKRYRFGTVQFFFY
jgi:hypothetical protein